MLQLDTLVWDNHACMPLRPGDTEFLPRLGEVRTAGVDVLSLNIACGRQPFSAAVDVARTYTDWVQARPDDYLLVRRAEDAETARRTGRLGICFDLEGADPLEGDVDNVRRLYDLGVRWMLPTYNMPNALGGGCLVEDEGLTDFGRQVVAAMNAVGMVVCASHCGYETARQLIAVSNAPVIFSHSNPRAMWDHPRNIPDDLMLACARRGGVVGIDGFGMFLGQNDAGSDRYASHIDYAIRLIGADHVGLALDFVFDMSEFEEVAASDPETFPPHLYGTGGKMVGPWQLGEVHAALLALGHSRDDLAKVFGGNHLRIARAVWAD